MQRTLRPQSLVSAVAILVAILIVPGASAAPPTPKPPTVAPVTAKPPAAVGNAQSVPRLADNPVINSFSTPTPKIVQGDPLRFDWIVVPGTGGSPITKVTINGPTGTTPYTSTLASGSYTLSSTAAVGFSATLTFTLTAWNAKGNTSTRITTVKMITGEEAWRKIEIMNMDSRPVNFSVGMPVDFQVFIKNHSDDAVVKSVEIYLLQAAQGGTKVVAKLMDVTLPPGKPTWQTLQDTGFTPAANGVYTLDIVYRGWHKTKNFKTAPTTMYTIQSAP